jgi:hypothetical protein
MRSADRPMGYGPRPAETVRHCAGSGFDGLLHRPGRRWLVLPGLFHCRRHDSHAGETRSAGAAGMTGLEFFALVVCAYIAVIIYEWTSRPGAGDSKGVNDRNDTKPV